MNRSVLKSFNENFIQALSFFPVLSEVISVHTFVYVGETMLRSTKLVKPIIKSIQWKAKLYCGYWIEIKNSKWISGEFKKKETV